MKVLIYVDKKQLRPIGGPAGYLYNLSIGLKKIYNTDIHFLNENESKESKNTPKSIIKRLIPKKILTKVQYVRYIKKALYSDGKEAKINFDDYDAIHFHAVADMYRNRELLKKYKGKIILTSHTPEAPYLEAYDYMKSLNLSDKFIQNSVEKLKEIDRYAFENCTDLIFPCKDATEPYMHTSTFFRENYNEFISKISYLPTGVNRPDSIQSPVLPSNIDRNKFMVCYVGRHNKIKGYDLLKKAAKKIQNIDKDIQFLIAGKEEPLHSDASLNNWYEFGWTNNPLGIEKMSNLFVLPNRETYFDLALIEALSVPSILLISNTGGNKYFKRFNSNSINFFESENVNDLVNKILYIKNNYSNYDKNKSREIYEHYFTPEIFAKNYVKTIEKIVKEKVQ